MGFWSWSKPRPAVEQHSANLAGQAVPYLLKRSARRRSIGLRIDDRGLTVSMPLRASERWLDSVLADKAGWVLEKLAQRPRPQPARVWEDGAHLPHLGELLLLQVRPALFAAPPQRQGAMLLLTVAADSGPAEIERQLLQWERQQALRLFNERVTVFAAQMGVQPSRVALSNARTRWGSCNARGSVRLNVRLLRLPLPLLDYVVVHELAHLRELNHAPAFWRVVEQACPDYAEQRRALRRYRPD